MPKVRKSKTSEVAAAKRLGTQPTPLNLTPLAIDFKALRKALQGVDASLQVTSPPTTRPTTNQAKAFRALLKRLTCPAAETVSSLQPLIVDLQQRLLTASDSDLPRLWSEFTHCAVELGEAGLNIVIWLVLQATRHA
jgi:hypothetical protein